MNIKENENENNKHFNINWKLFEKQTNKIQHFPKHFYSIKVVIYEVKDIFKENVLQKGTDRNSIYVRM